MTTQDAQSLGRESQVMLVEYNKGIGSPPQYGNWTPMLNAKVGRIEINKDGTPSSATILFPTLRWDEYNGLNKGDMIRIRTFEANPSQRTIIFVGFYVTSTLDFGGGNTKSSYEYNTAFAFDYRWVLSMTSPIDGQMARSPDDYTDYGTDGQLPIGGKFHWMSGRRVIFNADGKADKDPDTLFYTSSPGTTLSMPLFADRDFATDPWTARDMINYCLSPMYNQAFDYIPLGEPNTIVGLDHQDFDKVLLHIVVDGLSIPDATDLICRNIGWGWRLDHFNNGSTAIVFYKLAGAVSYQRSSTNPIILQELHAPAPGEDISLAVANGRRMLWQMTLAHDITALVNNPLGLGSPHKFEFTAELVPAWKDSNLAPDSSDNYDNLYFTDADLQSITNPDSKSFYKYYHPRGSQFKRDVGRKWALNEAGRYSASGTYNRGMPFDFATVIDSKYIKDEAGERTYGPFNRQLLPCITADKDSLNSVGYKLEFSFDGGTTWQVIPASVTSLKDECGIYIEEANLAELVDQKEGTISGGYLDGKQLNLWTSLSDDKINSRAFKDNEWKTRVRVTASVQMDKRLTLEKLPGANSGSPFLQSRIYDFSREYELSQRTASSVFNGSDLPPLDVDASAKLEAHLAAIQQENEDASVSGRFTLDRLWLGDGSGTPLFAIGDSISRITGREFDLSANIGSSKVFPEIIKIVYTNETQKTTLITRDLRFAEVVTP